MKRYKVGQILSRQLWQAVDGSQVAIPSADKRCIWLKFSRWAGCPICNLHIAEVRHRNDELQAAGIDVVMAFHSPSQDVRDLRGELPFKLIADPEKKKYKAFGVGGSLLFLAHRKAIQALRIEAKRGNKAQRVHGGILTLPADFLIGPRGELLAAHYGNHADDNLEVDEVLRASTKAERTCHM